MKRYGLPSGNHVLIGHLPDVLVLPAQEFEVLWNQHPPWFHRVRMWGKLMETARWQQSYGYDYAYSGSCNNALPMEELTARVPRLEYSLRWCQEHIDERLNGVLINWYDAHLSHRIGKHRDSTAGLVVDAPYVTLSFGANRVFRLRRYDEPRVRVDLPMSDGSVIAIPAATNEAWTHEVPHLRRYPGRRISVTLRGFEPD